MDIPRQESSTDSRLVSGDLLHASNQYCLLLASEIVLLLCEEERLTN